MMPGGPPGRPPMPMRGPYQSGPPGSYHPSMFPAPHMGMPGMGMGRPGSAPAAGGFGVSPANGMGGMRPTGPYHPGPSMYPPPSGPQAGAMEALRANLSAMAKANMQRQAQQQQAERDVAKEALSVTDGAVVSLVMLGENNALKSFGASVQREFIQAGWHAETHYLDFRTVGVVLDTSAVAGYRYALLIGDSGLKDKTVKMRDFGAPEFRAATHLSITEAIAYVNGREGPNSKFKLTPPMIKEVLDKSSQREKSRRRQREEEVDTKDVERDPKRRASSRPESNRDERDRDGDRTRERAREGAGSKERRERDKGLAGAQNGASKSPRPSSQTSSSGWLSSGAPGWQSSGVKLEHAPGGTPGRALPPPLERVPDVRKDRERDRARDREREREGERARDREKEREKERVIEKEKAIEKERIEKEKIGRERMEKAQWDLSRGKVGRQQDGREPERRDVGRGVERREVGRDEKRDRGERDRSDNSRQSEMERVSRDSRDHRIVRDDRDSRDGRESRDRRDDRSGSDGRRPDDRRDKRDTARDHSRDRDRRHEDRRPVIDDRRRGSDERRSADGRELNRIDSRNQSERGSGVSSPRRDREREVELVKEENGRLGPGIGERNTNWDVEPRQLQHMYEDYNQQHHDQHSRSANPYAHDVPHNQERDAPWRFPTQDQHQNAYSQDPSHSLSYPGEQLLPPSFPDPHSYPHDHSRGHQPTALAPIAYAPERGAPFEDRGDHRTYDREPWADVGGHQPEEVYLGGRDFGNLSRELEHYNNPITNPSLGRYQEQDAWSDQREVQHGEPGTSASGVNLNSISSLLNYLQSAEVLENGTLPAQFQPSDKEKLAQAVQAAQTIQQQQQQQQQQQHQQHQQHQQEQQEQQHQQHYQHHQPQEHYRHPPYDLHHQHHQPMQPQMGIAAPPPPPPPPGGVQMRPPLPSSALRRNMY